MRRIIAALAIAVVPAAVPVDAQETEITVGGGLGLELFDEHLLTYPTAELGLTRWWAGGGARRSRDVRDRNRVASLLRGHRVLQPSPWHAVHRGERVDPGGVARAPPLVSPGHRDRRRVRLGLLPAHGPHAAARRTHRQRSGTAPSLLSGVGGVSWHTRCCSGARSPRRSASRRGVLRAGDGGLRRRGLRSDWAVAAAGASPAPPQQASSASSRRVTRCR